VLGSLFVVLGMGMGTIHFSLALSNLIRERLPSSAGSCAKAAPPRARRPVTPGRMNPLSRPG